MGYKEYKQLNLPEVAAEVLEKWEREDTFKESIRTREGNKPYVFYEGPPSANGMPGIHHVMARAIKDIFCRFQTLKGRHVKRKAGWDTHGLPVELGVEKELGITKEDIGKKISIAEYNDACRKAVMKYTDQWEQVTRQMGYWVDMENPYVTYDNKYIETVWWLLKKIYDKKLLYKGYNIQPYSPAAGTGLSSHELNQPGCYKNVKDVTAVAMFRIPEGEKTPFTTEKPLYAIAWTTTPWTLPGNTALAVGKNIQYAAVETFNPYTGDPCTVILAEELIGRYFNPKAVDADFESYKPGDKLLPYKVIGTCKGSELEGTNYEQLLPYAKPFEDADKAFRFILGDYVTTTDGTGIVHIAPTFGADDMRVARESGIPPMLVLDENEKPVPVVDLTGKFRKEISDPVFGLGGEPVKEAYLSDEEKESALKVQQERLKEIIPKLDKYLSVDDRISLKLKLEGKAFRIEKYEHNYPHCWRTDKPVLYYPLDSWFIKITAVKERMAELNKTINWKPESTGTGRFGNWLENANDWNLSRSRYWGIPLPVWRSEDGEEICIGSMAQLKEACDSSVKQGLMNENPLRNFKEGDFSKENYSLLDLHRPYVDDIILSGSKGQPMHRETDLIDVWFDSGSMPYAQVHYPFENKEEIDNNLGFPADFIAEGVDQTRGWFYTLHAIGTLCFDSVAYRNVVSNGLVLDKNGQKMSKRLGNAVDPFKTLDRYGADATRWYMITNAQPWDNLKFDEEGLEETQRKFFRALHNTYAFFSLYANLDNFSYEEEEIAIEKRPEIDRWILSRLQTLSMQVENSYSEYEPTRAGRLIEEFVLDDLSNWYVRLCRRRFWKGEYNEDKIAAYQTLYTCLETVSILAAPIAPFYSDRLFNDLNTVSKRFDVNSVHLATFPEVDKSRLDQYLEEKMAIAQKVTSMVLSLRKKQNIRVRQPLGRIMIPVLDEKFEEQLRGVEQLILSEVNVKEIEYLKDNSVLVKQIKANFKALGPRYGKQMKAIAAAITGFSQDDINRFEKEEKFELEIGGEKIILELGDVEIVPEDIPGWLVTSESGYTVALDVTITEELKEEGIARELVNRIQNLRKERGLEVTDRIEVKIVEKPEIGAAIQNNLKYICSETLASDLQLVPAIEETEVFEIEVDENISTQVSINKLN